MKSKKFRKENLGLIASLVFICVILLFSLYFVEKPKTTDGITGMAPVKKSGGVVFTGNLVYLETIQKDSGEYIFSMDLEDRKRYVIEGTFNQPVNLLVLEESYYNAWTQDRKLKIYAAYVKDHAKELYSRFDINEGAAGTYYVILRSKENILSGDLRIIEVADL